MKAYNECEARGHETRGRRKVCRLKALNRRLRIKAQRGEDTAAEEKELDLIYRKLYCLRMKG